MKLSFSELLTEGMGEAIEFYMTDDTAPPKQYYGAFELNGEQYGMSFVQTTTARHFTFEFYRIANKNKKYWDIRKGGDWNVIVPTVMRFIEMVYTMSKSQCDSIIIRVPDTPKLASRQKFLERIIRKSFVKTMTYVPVQRLTEQKFTHIYLVKKGVDPKSIFNGAVFKKHFSFDIKDTPVAELVTDENLAALTDPYKYQKPKPSLRPSKLAFGKYMLDTDSMLADEIGAEIDVVTGALVDPALMKVVDKTSEDNNKTGLPPVKAAAANVVLSSGNDSVPFVLHYPTMSDVRKKYVTSIFAYMILNMRNGVEVSKFESMNDIRDWYEDQFNLFDVRTALRGVYHAVVKQGFLLNNNVISTVFKEADVSMDWVSADYTDISELGKTDFLDIVNAFAKIDIGYGIADYRNMFEVQQKHDFTSHIPNFIGTWLLNSKFTDRMQDALESIPTGAPEDHVDVVHAMALFQKYTKEKTSEYLERIRSNDKVFWGFWCCMMSNLVGQTDPVNGIFKMEDHLEDMFNKWIVKPNVVTNYFSSKEGNQTFLKNIRSFDEYVFEFEGGHADTHVKVPDEIGGSLAPTGVALIDITMKNDNLDSQALALGVVVYTAMMRVGMSGMFSGKLTDDQNKKFLEAMLNQEHGRHLLNSTKEYLEATTSQHFSKLLAGVGPANHSWENVYADIALINPELTVQQLGEYVQKTLFKVDTTKTPEPEQWLGPIIFAGNLKTAAEKMASAIMLMAMTQFSGHITNGINMSLLTSNMSLLEDRAMSALQTLGSDQIMYETVMRIMSVGDGAGKSPVGKLVSHMLNNLSHIAMDYEPNKHKEVFLLGAANARRFMFGDNGISYDAIDFKIDKPDVVGDSDESGQSKVPKHYVKSTKTLDIGTEMKVDENSPFDVDNYTAAGYGEIGYQAPVSTTVNDKQKASKRSYLKTFPGVKDALDIIDNSSSYMYSYTGSSHRVINNSLRQLKEDNASAMAKGEKIVVGDFLAPFLQEFDKHAVSIDKPFWVYRNTSVPDADSYKVGDDIIDMGFLSTTISNSMPYGKGSTRLKIFVPAGTKFFPAFGVGQNGTEDEIILPPLAINRIVEMSIVDRYIARYCFTCLYSGTAYKSAYDFGNTVAESVVMKAKTATISELKRLIEEKTAVEKPKGDYNPNEKWGSPIGADSKTIAEWLKKLKKKK